jgi:hypothetical protein
VVRGERDRTQRDLRSRCYYLLVALTKARGTLEPVQLLAQSCTDPSQKSWWQQLEAATKHPEGSFKVINALAMAGSCGEPSSHQTHRWRKADSNPRSRSRRLYFETVFPLYDGSISRNGSVCALPGLRVRIRLAPADSLGLTPTQPLPVEKPAVPRGCALAKVGRDTKYCRKCANRRCYLCRAIFQYRSVADVVRGIPGSLPRRSWRWAQIKQSRAASAARARLAADVSGRAACLL